MTCHRHYGPNTRSHANDDAGSKCDLAAAITTTKIEDANDAHAHAAAKNNSAGDGKGTATLLLPAPSTLLLPRRTTVHSTSRTSTKSSQQMNVNAPALPMNFRLI